SSAASSRASDRRYRFGTEAREQHVMAMRTETVTYHSCDLCGEDRDEADLTRLYGSGPKVGQRPQIDICTSCQARPVADVVEWLRSTQGSTAPRPLRGVRGGASR